MTDRNKETSAQVTSEPDIASAPELRNYLQNVMQKRIEAMKNFLKLQSHKVYEDQKHLDSNSESRAYWHHGYLIALQDISKLLSGDWVKDTPTVTALNVISNQQQKDAHGVDAQYVYETVQGPARSVFEIKNSGDICIGPNITIPSTGNPGPGNSRPVLQIRNQQGLQFDVWLTSQGLRSTGDLSPDEATQTLLAGIGHWIQDRLDQMNSEPASDALQILAVDPDSTDWSVDEDAVKPAEYHMPHDPIDYYVATEDQREVGIYCSEGIVHDDRSIDNMDDYKPHATLEATVWDKSNLGYLDPKDDTPLDSLQEHCLGLPVERSDMIWNSPNEGKANSVNSIDTSLESDYIPNEYSHERKRDMMRPIQHEISDPVPQIDHRIRGLDISTSRPKQCSCKLSKEE